MAGHSKFKNIMHRKGAQDKKRAKLFARLIREISVATKLGLPDPNANPRLRTAINNALSANMPKENIDRAIKKNSESDSSTQIEEITYEGFGPGGVAIIIEAMTDNKNRTASEIRSTFNKYGGNLGETGSVSFSFKRLGSITLNKNNINEEELRDLLKDALRTLPEREALVIQLYYVEELNVYEIAEVLEVTTGRVSQIKKSAISSLRHFLGEREALILKG